MTYSREDKTVATDSQQTYKRTVGDANVHLAVGRLLTKLGFKSKLMGTRFLEDAILYRYENAGVVYAGITKSTYIAVAEAHRSTSTRVERAIRNAIVNCYTHGSLMAFNEMTKSNVIHDKYPPSNGEFVCSVVNWLRLEQQSGHIFDKQM